MSPTDEYKLMKGTLIGEIRHEVFQRHGLDAYESAHYWWGRTMINESKYKWYTLVNSNPIQFLVATTTYSMIDMRPINPQTNQRVDDPPLLMIDEMNPTQIDFEWVDANIPFATKEVIDSQGIFYNLP